MTNKSGASRPNGSRLVPGAIECLTKPFDLNDLLAWVAHHGQPMQALIQSWHTN